jgi:methanogenic corrinoid protein MtbC1
MESINIHIRQSILACKDVLAVAITDRQYAINPELSARYGEVGYVKCIEDARYHLNYLAQAIGVGSSALFMDYIGWAKIMLARRGISVSDLRLNLECMRELLPAQLPHDDMIEIMDQTIQMGLQQLEQSPSTLPSFLVDASSLSVLSKDYLSALLRGERHCASRLILDAVYNGVSVKDIYLHVFQYTQREIGRLWQMNQLTVGQEHYCTAATQLIMTQLYPHIFETSRIGRRLVATCVKDELHEMGVRMIADLFEMSGWDTFYLGANTPAASVIDMIARQQAHVLGISATMTIHVGEVAALIRAVRESEVGGQVKLIVGGYPFNIDPNLWRAVGADACAGDADQAIAVAHRLLLSGDAV